jgi:peptidoglycan/LPS O-acetylase OafA/YrhL
MNLWFRRLRGVVGMGLVWAVVWAVVGGGIMEAFVDPRGEILDMWPQVLGIAGFLGGAAFSVAFGIAARRRSFEELSLARFSALGALAGVVVGGFLMTTGAPALIIAPAALLCAGSASASLALARRGNKRDLLDVGASDTRIGGGE